MGYVRFGLLLPAMPNRSFPPAIILPQDISLPPARQWTLSNGLKVLAVDGAKSPILRLELIFDAGRPFEHHRLVARATNELMTEGTRQKSAAELEAFFEHYGTSLGTPSVFDTGHLVLYTILPHLPEILPVLAEVIVDPAFRAREFNTFIRRAKQDLREEGNDPDTIAYRHFTEFVFGETHPYGYNGYPATYSQLDLANVKAHHQRAYTASNATLLLAGQVTTAVEDLLERYLGQIPTGKAQQPTTWSAQTMPPDLRQLYRPRAQQTLIRMGHQLVGRDHPDYPGLIVLNTLFGDFFGSRLMRNIREEKGYTYGIDSSIDFMRFGSYLTIAADVANENLDNVRREIRHEIDLLCTDLVPAKELDLVRSFLLGNLIMEIDGPLNIAERYQATIISNCHTNYFERLVTTVRQISSAELRDLAQRYLGSPQSWEVIVGGAKLLPGATAFNNQP